MPLPGFKGRAFQDAEVPPVVLRENALEKSIAQGCVARGVGFSCVPLPHEAVEAEIICIVGLHVKIHRQQIQHCRREGFLFLLDLDARNDLPACLCCCLEATDAVYDVALLTDHDRHEGSDLPLQGFCELLCVGVEIAVVRLCELHGVHPAQRINARVGLRAARFDVGQGLRHGLDVHFVQTLLDDRAGVLLLEVVRGPVEQDVDCFPLAELFFADVLHRDFREAHATGDELPLVSAQNFAVLVRVDGQQEAELAQGQLRQGQTLLVIPAGVIL